MNEQDLKKIFETHKVDVPDEGFSEHVIRQLPERKSMVPQIVMAVFVMIGLAFMFAIVDVTLLLEQINSLITSISHLQTPSLSAVSTYIGLFFLTGIMGYTMIQTDVD